MDRGEWRFLNWEHETAYAEDGFYGAVGDIRFASSRRFPDGDVYRRSTKSGARSRNVVFLWQIIDALSTPDFTRSREITVRPTKIEYRRGMKSYVRVWTAWNCPNRRWNHARGPSCRCLFRARFFYAIEFRIWNLFEMNHDRVM